MPANAESLAGDIILRYGNMQVKEVRALARAIAHTQPGTVVSLRIWRNDEPLVVAATVQGVWRAASSGERRLPHPPLSAPAGTWRGAMTRRAAVWS